MDRGVDITCKIGGGKMLENRPHNLTIHDIRCIACSSGCISVLLYKKFRF